MVDLMKATLLIAVVFTAAFIARAGGLWLTAWARVRRRVQKTKVLPVGHASVNGVPHHIYSDGTVLPLMAGGADENEIRQALGLDDDGDILQAITGLQEQVATYKQTLEADAPEKGEVARLRAELSEANKRIIALDIQKNREVLSLRERVRHMEAEHRVDQAVAIGRITPANREIALKVALGESEEEFEKFVKTLPSVDMSELGSSGRPELAEYEPTQEEIAIARQMGNWDDSDPVASRIRLMRAKGAPIPEPKKE